MALNMILFSVILLVVSITLSCVAADDDSWIVSWNAPFLTGSSGYGSEATSFLLGLNRTLSKEKWKIGAGLAHGDVADRSYIESLPESLLSLFKSVSEAQFECSNKPEKTIVVCHSEPGAWSVPKSLYNSGWPCPPHLSSNGKRWKRVVGRTMFETDRLPKGWNDRLNQVDEVWVPTHHHRQIFVDAGVTKPVVVVGQGIDIDFWDPDKEVPLDFQTIDPDNKCSEDDYKFLSVFKWETRKGPDVLIPSFFNAFPNGEGACLIIVTSLYHRDAELVLDEVQNYWDMATNNSEGRPPRGIILVSGLPMKTLIRLYKSVDAFALPSRGEGWGRPYMEAMAMSLPVIATNWSGPTEFLNENNGYLLPIRGLVDANLESFPDHKWADPDPEELERLMKYLKEHQNEAKQKGEQARRDVAQKWSNNVLSQVVAGHLERLTDPPSSLSEERDEL